MLKINHICNSFISVEGKSSMIACDPWYGRTILGDCNIGNNVIFAANSFVLDIDVPSNSIVYGRHPNVEVKKITSEHRFFNIFK